MWPFTYEYDIWIVDYKVIIKENLTYNRGRVIFWALIILGFTSLGFLMAEPEAEPPLDVSLLIITIELVFFSLLFLTRRPNGIIEIDNEAKIIRVRDKYDIDANNVTCIKVLELKGNASSYVYDYLALICDSETETGIYKIIRGSIADKATARIARLIAEKLKLTLIVETQEPTSFGKRKKAIAVY